MTEVVCLSVSVYRDALTRGRRYTVLATDDRDHYRIQGDNGRIRSFPMDVFDQSDRSVPTLTGYQIDDPIPWAHWIEVTVQLSNDERRWCHFATPSSLAGSGNRIEGTKVRFHYGYRHLIIAEELSEDLIGKILRHIDDQGELEECTLPLEDD